MAGTVDPTLDTDDALEIVSKTVSERGVDGEVTHHTTAMGESVFTIKSIVNGEKHVNEISMTASEVQMSQNPADMLARKAEQASRGIRSKFVNRIDWNDNLVQINESGHTSTQCLICDEEVSIADLKEQVTSFGIAESTVPQPTTMADVKSLSDHKIRFALLGLLDRECERTGCHRKI